MKKHRKLLGRLPWLFAVAVFSVHAEQDITARVGTLGLGVEYGHSLSEKMGIRFGLNGAARDFSSTESDIDYDFTMKLRSADVLVDWRPFGGVFFTSFGALYNKNKLTASAKTSAPVKVGNTTYPSGTNLTGEVTFNTLAPYLGVGWGSSPKRTGFILRGDLGLVYQGKPKVKLSSNSGISQADLDRETSDLQSSVDDYKYYPHVGFSIGARF